jgi:hypothetical protein
MPELRRPIRRRPAIPGRSAALRPSPVSWCPRRASPRPVPRPARSPAPQPCAGRALAARWPGRASVAVHVGSPRGPSVSHCG